MAKAALAKALIRPRLWLKLRLKVRAVRAAAIALLRLLRLGA